MTEESVRSLSGSYKDKRPLSVAKGGKVKEKLASVWRGKGSYGKGEKGEKNGCG